MAGTLRCKRVYLPPEPEDGKRILADRLWPRGVSKERAALHQWRRDCAPSDAVRKSYCHDTEKFPDFRTAYRAELDSSADAAALVKDCEAWLADGNVTLLFGAKDAEHSNAAVLKEWLEEKLR